MRNLLRQYLARSDSEDITEGMAFLDRVYDARRGPEPSGRSLPALPCALMETPEVVIEHGLPDELREQAVALFEEAFGTKMSLSIRDREKRMAFATRAFRAEHAIVARRGGQLLGMAGLDTRGEPYRGGLMDVSWDPRPYVDLLGWLGAMWAVWGLRAGGYKPRDDELHLDGIAVAPQVRGQGIGTRLLAEATNTARRHGKRFVRLDVVDTNPRAQALYERVGYRVTRVQSYGWSQRWFGFGAMISMEQPVHPDAPTASVDGDDIRP